MTHRKIPVACVQTQAHDRKDFQAAWPRIRTLVVEAASHGAKLVVLPEGTVPGYVLGSAAVDEREVALAAADVAELASSYRTTIVYGGVKISDGRTYNAAIAVGPDGYELGHAAKQFLWHFDRRWFTAGATLDPIETPLGTLGLLVCADGRIPSIAATLVERGAELLVMPTAWVTSGRDPHSLENLQADLMAGVRARENGVPFLVANKCGVELQSVAYCGKSALYDADGATLARASESDEAIVYGEIVAAPSRRSTGTAFAPPRDAANGPQRARIAFTLASDPADVERFAVLATQSDADVLLARGATRGRHAVLAAHETGRNDIIGTGGILIATVDTPTFTSPRGLIEARLAGFDLFLWHADGDAAWHTPFARTRAAELRAFVVVFSAATGRAFAVDPDGAVVAGTFGEYRLASFVYDRSRSAATLLAPTTDAFEGLRAAEAIRARALAQVR